MDNSSFHGEAHRVAGLGIVASFLVTGCQFGGQDPSGLPGRAIVQSQAASTAETALQIQYENGYWLGNQAVPLTAQGNAGGPGGPQGDGDRHASNAQSVWTTKPGLQLRELLARWIEQANDVSCAANGSCFKLAGLAPDSPPEPWRLLIADSFQGDFLTALAWLQAGFLRSPRPDIEVTRNNVVILRPLGAFP